MTSAFYQDSKEEVHPVVLKDFFFLQGSGVNSMEIIHLHC